jgi:hypothetical protein
MKGFVLKTQYTKSPTPYDEDSEDNITRFLRDDLGISKEHFELQFNEDKNKVVVKCNPCNKTMNHTSEYVLQTHFQSQGHEKALSKLEPIVVEGVNPNDYFVHLGKWGCNLCSETEATRYMRYINQHFECHHPKSEEEEEEDSLPPKKRESPEKKRPLEEEEEDSLDELIQQELEKRIEQECQKKMKDENYINEIIEENMGLFDNMFQQKQVDRLIAKRLERILNKIN